MNDFIQRIEREIIKFNDIQSVLMRLVQSKFMIQIKSLFESIFQTERSHIMTVLSKQQKDKIVDSYVLNLNILKQNLKVITSVVIDEIYSDFKTQVTDLKYSSLGVTNNNNTQLITIHEQSDEKDQKQMSQRCYTETNIKKQFQHMPLSKLTLKCLLKK
ncbi:unnamed protein product [Paramecium octaurelia]|uniref:Uncharacterized protein n=1 Tax=Paramecium octaurelia TaxID=43137 RepID=A0A8S1TNV2_PAROT|nr:unnamed protein product [Paramecium octaurelia]